MSKKYSNVSVTKLPKGIVQIEGEIPADVFAAARPKAIQYFTKNIEIDGFRKGAVPEKILLEKVGENRVLEEMAEIIMAEEIPIMLVEHEIRAIARPNVGITKLATGNPLGFKLTIPVMPEVKLPDYKAIAKKSNAEAIAPREVTDEDVQKAIDEIRHEALHHIEGHEHTPDETLPELTDDLVQKLGAFENVADFTQKIREGITEDFKRKAAEKKRMEMLDAITTAAEVDMPDLLVEHEIDRIIGVLRADIERVGLTFEGYLGHLKKTAEDLRNDVRPDGEKRAKLQVVIAEIAKAEKLSPDAARIEKDVAAIRDLHKDAKEDNVRAYVELLLMNEAVIKFLEGIKG